MNVARLREILIDTTVQLRKGNEVEGTPALVEAVKNIKDGDKLEGLPGGVVSINKMPYEQEEMDDTIEKVDCHFIVVGVDKVKAIEYKDEVCGILKEWPNEAWGQPMPKLEEGPSYIHVGGVLDDQGMAFQLFALGQVLGLWTVVTPEKMGFTGSDADQMAGAGFVMIDGFKPDSL